MPTSTLFDLRTPTHATVRHIAIKNNIANMQAGTLSIVGAGLITAAHLTQQARNRIEQADQVFALLSEPVGISYLAQLNPNLKNLADYYYHPEHPERGQNRVECYQRMAEVIMQAVRSGVRVAAVFYGHPAVFVQPAHLLLQLCRRQAIEVEMLPGISAEDCLYAELGVDPGEQGVQSLEATQFILCQHQLNPYSPLILWQLGVVGDTQLKEAVPATDGLCMLEDKLLKTYSPQHQVLIYEASVLPIAESRISRFSLSELHTQQVSTISTLWVPAVSEPPLDYEFCQRWAIDHQSLLQSG